MGEPQKTNSDTIPWWAKNLTIAALGVVMILFGAYDWGHLPPEAASALILGGMGLITGSGGHAIGLKQTPP